MPVDAWTAIAEKIRPLQSCTVHHQTVAIPVDIPSRWEPRAKQSRTVALLAALRAAALFKSSRRTVNRSLLLDIPTGWEPRTKQQPTGLVACPAAQGRAVRILPAH